MIDTGKLEQLFRKSQVQLKRNSQNYQQEYWQNNCQVNPCTQIIKGATQRVSRKDYSGRRCRYYSAVAVKYNIIPLYCFDCYKIVIKPRTIVELFSLKVVFDEIELPKNNSRKCMVELRPELSDPYKGYVYSYDLEEALRLLETIKEGIARKISSSIPVSLKRGCSEYAQPFPDFEKIDQDGKPVMQYQPEWEEIEEQAAKIMASSSDFAPITVDNHDDLWNSKEEQQVFEARVILFWIKYAATIGDQGYLEISGKPVPKFTNLQRPMFQSEKARE